MQLLLGSDSDLDPHCLKCWIHIRNETYPDTRHWLSFEEPAGGRHFESSAMVPFITLSFSIVSLAVQLNTLGPDHLRSWELYDKLKLKIFKVFLVTCHSFYIYLFSNATLQNMVGSHHIIWWGLGRLMFMRGNGGFLRFALTSSYDEAWAGWCFSMEPVVFKVTVSSGNFASSSTWTGTYPHIRGSNWAVSEW